jgi:hypothetical protein
MPRRTVDSKLERSRRVENKEQSGTVPALAVIGLIRTAEAERFRWAGHLQIIDNNEKPRKIWIPHSKEAEEWRIRNSQELYQL